MLYITSRTLYIFMNIYAQQNCNKLKNNDIHIGITILGVKSLCLGANILLEKTVWKWNRSLGKTNFLIFISLPNCGIHSMLFHGSGSVHPNFIYMAACKIPTMHCSLFRVYSQPSEMSGHDYVLYISFSKI